MEAWRLADGLTVEEPMSSSEISSTWNCLAWRVGLCTRLEQETKMFKYQEGKQMLQKPQQFSYILYLLCLCLKQNKTGCFLQLLIINSFKYLLLPPLPQIQCKGGGQIIETLDLLSWQWVIALWYNTNI